MPRATRSSPRPKALPTPPLQPLRIPNTWTVGWNTFYELDPVFRSWDVKSLKFTEDMLQIEGRGYGVLLDLGWYPAHRASGSFVLLAVRLYEDPEHGWTGEWERPLQRATSRSRRKIVATIEAWMFQYGKHPPMLKRTARRRRKRRPSPSKK